MGRRAAGVRRLVAALARPSTRGAAFGRLRRVASGDTEYAARWSRLAAAVLGPDATTGGRSLEPAATPRIAGLAERQRAQAALAEAVARGAGLETAVSEAVVALAATDEWADWNAGWSLCEGVASLPGGTGAATLGRTILLHRRRQLARTWSVASTLDDDTLARHVPVAAVEAALAAALSGADSGARDRAHAIASRTDGMDDAVLVDLAGRFVAVLERERAKVLLHALGSRPAPELDAGRRRLRTQLERWLGQPSPTVPPGSIPVAVMTRQLTDPAEPSPAPADSIEALGMLGCLVRLADVAFDGEDGLGSLATELQRGVPAGHRVAGPRGSIHLVALPHDLPSMGTAPDGTWMIAFGSHDRPLFDLRFDFPYPPAIRPLFVSFHVSQPELLTDAAIDDLRRHGPVGCRDWNTVFMLLSAGVDAFFTGDISTTVDTVVPTPGSSGATPSASGPLRLGEDVPPAEQLRATASFLSGGRGLERAGGDLHASLALASLGVPVEFRPRATGDIRLAGLMGIRSGDARLAAMRDGIRDLIAAVFERILAGADEADVYGYWRALTRERLEEARAAFGTPVADTPTEIDLRAAVRSAADGARRFGPHAAAAATGMTDVVLAFDQNLLHPAAVLVESLVEQASGPVRLWVLGRGLPDNYLEWLGAAFPSLPITFLPCDAISYDTAGRRRRIPRRITVSTMDRLLLPMLLPDVRRVVYLDTDTLLLGDICELAATDLAGCPIAARDSNVTETSEWQRAGRALDEPVATELRRVMGARHGFGHAALNAGVLILDLERLRRDDFTSRFLGFGERYGLHDQDTMLAYAGPDRVALSPRWNAMPVLEDVPDPLLIHWASFPKPWDPPLTYARARWREVADRLGRRAGLPPGIDVR